MVQNNVPAVSNGNAEIRFVELRLLNLNAWQTYPKTDQIWSKITYLELGRHGRILSPVTFDTC